MTVGISDDAPKSAPLSKNIRLQPKGVFERRGRVHDVPPPSMHDPHRGTNGSSSSNKTKNAMMEEESVKNATSPPRDKNRTVSSEKSHDLL